MKILSIFGTRPEAIKMAPVVSELSRRSDVESFVCVTGQHREMLDQVMKLFQIEADFDLEVMRDNQSLNGLLGRIIDRVDALLAKLEPDWVLVHGDTTSAMAASIASFHKSIKIGHVEAGLRTYDVHHPWPEEFNRRVIDIVGSMLFAPTARSAQNLRSEKLDGKVIVTGNTVIDTLKHTVHRIETEKALAADLGKTFAFLNPLRRLLLVTGHRRESFGEGFEHICMALQTLAARTDLDIVYPVHLNPHVHGPVYKLLSGYPNIHLIDPQGYLEFVYLMYRADIILTDSGGVQEEAPSLGKPVLVMRDVTERPEAVEAGVVRLVGTKSGRLISEVERQLNAPKQGGNFTVGVNPYGDGQAARRIVAALMNEPFAPFTGLVPQANKVDPL